MKNSAVTIKKDGWTTIQEADAKKHILEISCRAENGSVVEVRIRHNDGEEAKGSVTCDGKGVLPISIEEFCELFNSGKLVIK